MSIHSKIWVESQMPKIDFKKWKPRKMGTVKIKGGNHPVFLLSSTTMSDEDKKIGRKIKKILKQSMEEWKAEHP